MSKREPFIGVTCEVPVPKKKQRFYELLCDYRYPEAVKKAGGFPILLPVARREQVIEKYLERIHGLIIVGGDDVNPRLYGEKPKKGTGVVFAPRLKFERLLYRKALALKIPILGICYGMQLINVLEGGTLFQDIRRDAKCRVAHNNKKDPIRRVRVEKDSQLQKILRVSRIQVHCEHHQAISRIAPGFKVAALSPEGIVEAIESRNRNLLAVQWHPERTPASKASRRLFKKFVEMCA